jgi:hypothetical protein
MKKELTFSPIVTKNSVFKDSVMVYMYMNDSGDSHIHMYEGMVNLGFNEDAKINFMHDHDNNVLFIFHHPDNGQTITKVKENHISVKCNDVFKRIGIKPLEATTDGKSNSGRHLFATPYKYDGFDGVIIDLNQFK